MQTRSTPGHFPGDYWFLEFQQTILESGASPKGAIPTDFKVVSAGAGFSHLRAFGSFGLLGKCCISSLSTVTWPEWGRMAGEAGELASPYRCCFSTQRRFQWYGLVHLPGILLLLLVLGGAIGWGKLLLGLGRFQDKVSFPHLQAETWRGS